MAFCDKVVTTATGEWLSPPAVRHRVAVRSKELCSSCSVVVINPDDEATVWVDWQAALANSQVPFVGPVSALQHFTPALVHSRPPVFLALTSGTTSAPQVLWRTVASWTAGFAACATRFALSPQMTIFCPSPLTTTLGLHSLVFALTTGRPFTRQLTAIEEQTALFAVPAYVQQHLADFPWAKIRRVILCGGTPPNELVRQIKIQAPHCRVFEAYGTAETSFIATQERTGDEHAGQVGRLFPRVRATTTVAGRLQVQSPYLYAGTAAHPQQVTTVVTDDYGTVAGQKVTLRGRAFDMISHGGNTFFPQVIETVVAPWCGQCAVFGVPDPTYEERVVLLVSGLQGTVAALRTRLQHDLPAYMVPAEIIRVAAIPLHNHKIARQVLCQQYLRGGFRDEG